jgi:hypothetical protein
MECFCKTLDLVRIKVLFDNSTPKKFNQYCDLLENQHVHEVLKKLTRV